MWDTTLALEWVPTLALEWVTTFGAHDRFETARAFAGSDFGGRKKSGGALDIGKALVRSSLSQRTTCASRLLG